MKTLIALIVSLGLTTAAFGGSCGSCCPGGGKKDGKAEKASSSHVELGGGCGGCAGDKDGKKKS